MRRGGKECRFRQRANYYAKFVKADERWGARLGCQHPERADGDAGWE